MALILGIETGTDICSVSLARNDTLLSLRESTGGQDHARKLAVYIDEVLRENRYTPGDLDAVAVGKGPGSYTGLRIGTSTAKGLCYGLGIPLIAVGSLDALAHVAEQDHRAGLITVEDWETARLCPMIDARRMEIYAQVFDTLIRPLSEVEAHIVTPESFGEFIGHGTQFVIFGNGAAKSAAVLPGNGVTHIGVIPSARGLVKPAFEAFSAGRFEDTAYFEPFYLKDFVVTASKKKLL